MNWGNPNEQSNDSENSEDDDDLETELLLQEVVNQPEEQHVIYSTDFDPLNRQFQTKSKATKQRTIYTKNMFEAMPKLQWLPGETLLVYGKDDEDEETLNKLKESAAHFKLMSLMIFSEKSDEISLLSFSTPLLTVYFDPRSKTPKIPQGIVDILLDTNIQIICPGATDWIYSHQWNQLDKLYNTFLYFGTITNLHYLDDFEKTLAINKSGKDVCEHMKMFYWLFQIKFDSFLHGGSIPKPLTPQWKNLVHLYGKLLVYCYIALLEKQRKYNLNSKFGVDISPIYLEKLIIHKNIYNELSEDDLRKKLIGNQSYPNPPLPNLPIPKKNK